ncbi:MAG: EAL domain-containing protein [Chromatiales bacterium]|nr:EAL domain-containing protein [Chromatiales bacterium]
MPLATASTGYSHLLREIDDLRAQRGVTGIALVLLQLDGVGEVNRSLGYTAGDEVLERVAGRLAAVGRVQDRIVALTRGVFALLVHNPLHAGHAALAAEKAIRVASESVDVTDGRARLRARAGVSFLPANATTASELLRQCEVAIREAGRRDKSHVAWSAALDGQATVASSAWFEIDDALHRGEFELHFQPKVNLRTGALSGAEALTRWRHPEHGLVSPLQFIPAIEGTDSARTLLRFVLNTSMRQAASWAQRWPGFTISVNASPTNLADADLGELIADVSRIWDFPVDRLVLEITETALMLDPDASTRRLHQLRSGGVKVSIDDFGTGYSSLAYLKNLPADELKIDKSFVQNIDHSEKDRRLVESIVQLGHAMGLVVVAEGIETEPMRAALVAMGCDTGQGYLFGRPVAAAAFDAFSPAG